MGSKAVHVQRQCTVCQGTGRVVSRRKVRAMAIEGVDIFGGRRDARVLYAGVAPREPLKRLRDKIEAALQRAGLAAEERKFHPHVTLARLRGAPADRIGRFLEANGLLMSPPIPVSDFVLYDSVRGNHGAVYREIERYGLHP